MHGTLRPGQKAYDLWNNKNIREFATSFTHNSHTVDSKWSGRGESLLVRKLTAVDIAKIIIKYRKDKNLINEPIFVLGHSFGGDVGIDVMNILDKYYSANAEKIVRPKAYL